MWISLALELGIGQCRAVRDLTKDSHADILRSQAAECLDWQDCLGGN